MDYDATIIVCGSRDYDDFEYIKRRLEEVRLTYFYDEAVRLVEGGASGADKLAATAGRSLGFVVVEVPAEWDKYGKSAGPRRNQRMVDEYDPYMVVAFPKGSLVKSRGTLDMVARSAEAGVMVIIF